MTRPGKVILGALIATGGLTGASPMICALPAWRVPGVQAEGSSRSDVDALIDQLGAFDVDRRISAARAVRRAPGMVALPALVDAAAGHADGFIRARALVLLSGYDDPRVADQMEQAISDPNDRLRAIAYQYFERHPEPRLAAAFVKALEAETSELARPALVRALAAHGSDARVQQVVLRQLERNHEAGRGVLLDALGEHKAAYATGAIRAVAAGDGPDRAHAVLALGRIGDRTAAALAGETRGGSPDVSLAAAAAGCLLGVDCEPHRRRLVEALTTRERLVGFEPLLDHAAAGLSAMAAHGDAVAGRALVDAGLAGDQATRAAAASALAALAARMPDRAVTMLLGHPDRQRAIALVREGFEMRHEAFEQEQFGARLRAAYFAEPEQSARRDLLQALVNEMEF